MTTYYVDFTTGDDGDTGLTEALAWKTIAKVNASSFSAGDSILFKRGETWSGTALVPISSGSVGNLITLADYGTGNKPVITGANAGNTCCNIAVNRHHYLIQNLDFIVAGSGAYGLLIEGYEVTVEDCESSLGIVGMQVDGATANAYNVTLTRCVVHNTEHHGIVVNYVDVAGPTDIIIQDCTVTTCGHIADAHHGIYIKHCSDVTVKNCIVTGAFASGIKLGDGCNTSTVTQNLCYSNGACGIIWISDGADGTGNEISYNICYSNVSNNIQLNDGALSGFVYNNTCVNAGGRGLSVTTAGGTPPTGHTIENNISFQDLGVVAANSTPLGIGGAAVQPPNNTFDYNDWIFIGSTSVARVDGVNKTFAEWQAWAGSPDVHGISADPAFTDVDNHDYHLLSSSPCINAGVDVGLTEDFDGNPVT